MQPGDHVRSKTMLEPDSGASDPASDRPDDRLDSWKEIAAYLRRDIRTVQRWEKLEGLPVHRHVHRLRGSAFAYRSEIDAWWATRRHDLQRADSQDTAVGRKDAEDAVGGPTGGGSEEKPPYLPSPRVAIIGLAAVLAPVVLAMLLSRQTASSRATSWKKPFPPLRRIVAFLNCFAGSEGGRASL
jgi:hypothetical protein